MGYHCAWGTCNSDSRYLSAGVSFIKFPRKDRNRLARWVYLCGRGETFKVKDVARSSRVCSKHFPLDQDLNVDRNSNLEPFNARPSYSHTKTTRRNPRGGDTCITEVKELVALDPLLDHNYVKKVPIQQNRRSESEMFENVDCYPQTQTCMDTESKFNQFQCPLQDDSGTMLESKPDIQDGCEIGCEHESPDNSNVDPHPIEGPNSRNEPEPHYQRESGDSLQGSSRPTIESEPDLRDEHDPFLTSELGVCNLPILSSELDVTGFGRKKKVTADKCTQTEHQIQMQSNTPPNLLSQSRKEAGWERMKQVNWLEAKESRLKYYTGFNFKEMSVLLEFLGPDIERVNIWKSGTSTPKIGPIPVKAKLYMTLERLRHAFTLVDLAERFGFSHEWCGKIFVSMCRFLYDKFSALREVMFVPKSRHHPLPLPFRNCLLQNVRVVIDCTEVYLQSSTDFRQQGHLYSNYKHHTTSKILIGVAPCGAAMFVSEAYEGAISDKEIISQSGFLSYLETGDEVLADRGFTIQEELAEKGAKLIIPPFLHGRKHFSKEEISTAKKIARARIHVERFNQRLKQFKILSGILPLSLIPLLSQIVFICCCFVNFQEPLCN